MYPTESLKDKEAGILNEVIKAGDKEEVVDQHLQQYIEISMKS